MPDSVCIEVVGWFIQEENVWFLDQCSGEKESCLLSSRETFYGSCEKYFPIYILWRKKVYSFENFLDITIDIVSITSRIATKIFSNILLFISSWHDLFCDGDMFS